MLIARKYALGLLIYPARRGYNSHQSKSRNFSKEDIAMSLRKVAGALALLAVIFVMGGGGNHAASPVDPLGLCRLASLCPRRPDYRYSGVPGGEPGQDPLLRHRPVRHFQQGGNLGRRQRPQRAG